MAVAAESHPDQRRQALQRDLSVLVLGSLLRNRDHQAAVDQPIRITLLQALPPERSENRGVLHRPAQLHGGFQLVHVLSAGTTGPAEQPVELGCRDRQTGIDLQVLHPTASAKAIVRILPATHQKHHFRRIGQQQMGLLIHRGSIAQHLQPLRLVGAEQHLPVAEHIPVLHSNRSH